MTITNYRRYQATTVTYENIKHRDVCRDYADRVELAKKIRHKFDEYYSAHKIITRDRAEQVRGSIIPDVLNMCQIGFTRLQKLWEKDPQKAMFTFL